MKLTITIDCDGAAFEESGPCQEASRILAVFANLLAHMTPESAVPYSPRQLFDVTGRNVGQAVITK